MKKTILTIILILAGASLAYGQRYKQDNVVKSLERDSNGEYHLKVMPFVNGCGCLLTDEDITVENGQVVRMYCHRNNSAYSLKSTCEYFELQLGLRNLGENNVTTAVYRSQLYEIRISDRGMVIELIKK